MSPLRHRWRMGWKRLATRRFLFDLGGGTFDVSVLAVGDGVCEVLATDGDTHLGGVDKVFVDWLAEDVQKTNGIDLLKDRQALQRFTEAAEKAIGRAGGQDLPPFRHRRCHGSQAHRAKFISCQTRRRQEEREPG